MRLEDLEGRGGMRLRSLAMVEVMVVACGVLPCLVMEKPWRFENGKREEEDGERA